MDYRKLLELTENNIEYRFGRLSCGTTSYYVQEGEIKDGDQIRNAMESLRIGRASSEWIADTWFISTESVADEIQKYLSLDFPKDKTYFHGIEPIECAHGKIFFSKISRMVLTPEERDLAKIGISKITDVSVDDIGSIVYSWRDESLRQSLS